MLCKVTSVKDGEIKFSKQKQKIEILGENNQTHQEAHKNMDEKQSTSNEVEITFN